MKYFIFTLFSFFTVYSSAQQKHPEAITISYFGEMLIRPGIRLNLDFNVRSRELVRTTKENTGKSIERCLLVSPSAGFFYHKRYQTGIFAIPELKFSRRNEKHGFFNYGIGAGFMHTFIPNTFEINYQGEVNHVFASHNYIISNYFISFGKKLDISKVIPISYYIKPQFLYAVPNFPFGTGYFSLELGLLLMMN